LCRLPFYRGLAPYRIIITGLLTGKTGHIPSLAIQ